MRSALFALLIGCGSPAVAPAPSIPSATPSAPIAAPTGPRLRLDRAPVRLGGGPTWASVQGVGGMRFCPGDRELIARDGEGRVHRYRVDDGRELVVNAVGGEIQSRVYPIECRADGAAVTIDTNGAPVIVDAKGKQVAAPGEPLVASDVKVDGNDVLVLTDDGVYRWSGDKIELAIKPDEHALDRGLGNGGTYIERACDDKTSKATTWVIPRGGKRQVLPGGIDDLAQVMSSPNGNLAVGGWMMAYGWVIKNGVPGKRQLLLDQSGVHIKAVAATDKWLAAMDAGGGLWRASPPAMKWAGVERPCGENEMSTTFAISNDETRAAIACGNGGIRILDLATFKQLSKDTVATSGGDTVAWSAAGSGLATRDDNHLRVWRGPDLVTTIDAYDGRGLWWESVSELRGTSGGDLTSWKIATGTATPIDKLSGSVAVHSPHGEVFSVWLDHATDRDQAVVIRDGVATPIDIPTSQVHWIVDAAISDDGKRAAFWRSQYNDTKPGSELIEVDLTTKTAKVVTRPVRRLAFVAGGTIETAGDTIRRVQGDTITEIGKHDSDIHAIAVAGDVIAVAGEDGVISLWSLAGKPLGKLAGHAAPVRGLAFAPDGHRLASIGSDATLVWELAP